MIVGQIGALQVPAVQAELVQLRECPIEQADATTLGGGGCETDTVCARLPFNADEDGVFFFRSHCIHTI